MRGHLDEGLVTGVDEGTHGPVELDGLPQTGEPVVRHQFRAGDHGTAHGGDHRDARLARRDAVESGQDLLPQLVHLRAVRGVVHRDHPGARRLGARLLDLAQRLRVAGNHRRRGPVHRRHRQPLPERGDTFAHRLDRLGDRQHAAAPRQRPQGPAAQHHHLRRVLQRQDARHRSRRDLALRVPDHGLGNDAGRLPHRGQRHHHRPQRRLHHIRGLEAMPPRQDVIQLPVHERRQRRRTLGQALREHR